MNSDMRNRLIAEYLNLDGYDFTYKEAEHAAMEYERLIEDEGWEKCEDSKKFAARFVEQTSVQTSRPKTDFKKHNKTAYRQAKSIAREEINNVTEELDSSNAEFLENVKKDFDEIKEDDEETSWSAVKYQIENSLEKKLREKHVRKKMIMALKKHSHYNYTDNELHVATDRIIKEVSEERAEFIKDKIMLAMNDADLKKEEKKIKHKLVGIFGKEKFWKGAGAEFGKNIYKKLTENFIQILAGLVTAIITGGNFMGIL